MGRYEVEGLYLKSYPDVYEPYYSVVTHHSDKPGAIRQCRQLLKSGAEFVTCYKSHEYNDGHVIPHVVWDSRYDV